MSAVGSILTNSGALTALNSIAQTSANTNNLQNELASGLSINSPSDNPAGYITAQGFTSQINGLTQATSNANQGVSLLQTAQSAIGQQIGVVQQLNSIAVQAANGTQTSSESQSLQNLVGQLTSQVSTIANQTSFNNINLLDGSFSGTQFQVGANEGQTMSLTIGSTTANNIGMNTSQAISNVYAGAAAGTSIGSGSGAVSAGKPATASTVTLTASGATFAASLGANAVLNINGNAVNVGGANSLATVQTDIDKVSGLKATINGKQLTISSAAGGNGQLSLTNDTASLGADDTALGIANGTTTMSGGAPAVPPGVFTAGTAQITGSNGGQASITTVANESVDQIAAAVNADSATTGVEAQATTSITLGLATATSGVSQGSFGFTLQAQSVAGNGNSTNTGNQVTVNATSVGQAVSQINATSSTTGIVASEDKNGNLVLKQNSGQNISVGVTAGTLTAGGAGGTQETGNFLVQGQVQLQSAGAFSVTGGNAMGVQNTSQLQSLAGINVSTTQGANQAINVVKFALQGLNNQDGQLGAVQQRMTATINNLTSTSTNATTALGVVQDANIPAVANQLTQAQIQAQSGVAALKSSTQLAQTYLSLLP